MADLTATSTGPDCDTNTTTTGASGGPKLEAHRLDNPSVESLQGWLNDNGFDAGVVDGMWGDNTKTAFEEAMRKGALEDMPDEVKQSLQHLEDRGITSFGEDLNALEAGCHEQDSGIAGGLLPETDSGTHITEETSVDDSMPTRQSLGVDEGTHISEDQGTHIASPAEEYSFETPADDGLSQWELDNLDNIESALEAQQQAGGTHLAEDAGLESAEPEVVTVQQMNPELWERMTELFGSGDNHSAGDPEVLADAGQAAGITGLETHQTQDFTAQTGPAVETHGLG